MLERSNNSMSAAVREVVSKKKTDWRQMYTTVMRALIRPCASCQNFVIYQKGPIAQELSF